MWLLRCIRRFGVRCVVVNGTVSRVTQLLLYRNHLVGYIPPAVLAGLAKLEVFDVSNNDLKGPFDLCAMLPPGRAAGALTSLGLAVQPPLRLSLRPFRRMLTLPSFALSSHRNRKATDERARRVLQIVDGTGFR